MAIFTAGQAKDTTASKCVCCARAAGPKAQVQEPSATPDHAGMGRKAGGAAAGARERQSVSVGKLNLVDLAGSERVHITGATGVPQEFAPYCKTSLRVPA